MKEKQELWLRYNLAVWARNPSVCILPRTLATPPVTLLCSEIYHQNIKFLTILPVLVDIFGRDARPAPPRKKRALPRPAPKITPGQESWQTFLHHQKFLGVKNF